MMTASRMKIAAAVMTYFAAHLQERAPASTKAAAREDYYAAEGDPGQWYGAGLSRVGLIEGEAVRARSFQMLSAGLTPDGTEKLAQNAGADLRRAGMDLTFSAPKSVSVLWAVADPEQRKLIEQSHERAVKSAVGVLERQAFRARTGKEGAEIMSAKMIAALFQHGTSREQDPQLHTHAFVMNLGVREDGKASSIDPITIMRWQKAIGAAYRVELAESLRQTGYQLERDGDAFRVVGVSREVEEHFSQRRQQILERLEELGLTGARAAQHVTLETRRAKSEIDPVQLQAEWLARAQEHGLSREAAAELAGDEPSALHDLIQATEVLQRVTEHEAVFTDRELYLAAFEAAQCAGNIADADILARTAKMLAVELQHPNGEIVFTTREMLEAERDVIEIARARAEQAEHTLEQKAVEDAIEQMQLERSTEEEVFALRDDQRQAVFALTAEAGGTTVLVGDAGTGKSTTLEAVQRAYTSAGYQVLGAALAGKAAASLSADAGIDAKTIDRLLFDVEQGNVELGPKTVLVVDEAGMVDSRKMVALSRLCCDSGAKLILVGDHKQLQPVGAGATFRHLADAIGSARLSHITRQREEWSRAAVRNLSKGEAAQAMAAYIHRGAVQVATTHRQAVRLVAAQYLHDRAAVGAERCQVIASTNAAVRDLTDEIRQQLKGSGDIQEAVELQVRDSRQEDRLETIELAVGERVVITRNLNQIGLKNGDFATVVAISPEQLTLRIDRLGADLDVLPATVSLKHGYAATTHKMQGATVDRLAVLGSEHTSREMSYVQGSRARDQTTWVFSAAKIEKIEAEIKTLERDPATGEMREHIEKMAFFKGPGLQPPTESMLKFARDVETKTGSKVEHPESFDYVRQYLYSHGKELKQPGDPLMDVQTELAEERGLAHSDTDAPDLEIEPIKVAEQSDEPQLESKNEILMARLQRVVEAMSREKQKVSTLDYMPIERSNDSQVRADRELIAELNEALARSARTRETHLAQQREQRGMER